METPPDTDTNLVEATKRFVWRLMTVFQNRSELLMVELQEERERLRTIIFLAAGIAVLGFLGGITLTAVIALAAGAEHALAALIILAAIYICGAMFFYIKLSRLLNDWESFSGTRDQLEKDREWLKNRN
jgi:uncharacterized membrane protein YqjE